MALGGDYGTAICAACANGRLDVVNVLLQKGADVRVIGEQMRTKGW
jgi:ankyrin repeat protein